MSTQARSSGGGGSRNLKKSVTKSTGAGGGSDITNVPGKKTDILKSEKEKVQPKPTAEQLRIAQITNCNSAEDPQMREKVATLIEMTQRSEEEVCCALYECDNNLERSVVFLLETLPIGAFETSSKKKKNKTPNTGLDHTAGGDGEWVDCNSKTDKREKSRNRISNRGGRGVADSRGWRGRETRENDKNLGESKEDRKDNPNRRNFRSDRWNNDRRAVRGGLRLSGRGPGRSDRGSSRQNVLNDHQEVELWDNTIAQNAEKQQSQTQDDAWGDWDNEEYVGSLKDSKVFTTSNLPNQTVANIVSGPTEVSAPPGLEQHHVPSLVLNISTSEQQGSHLNPLVSGTVNSVVNDKSSNATGTVSPSSTISTTQFSVAVSNSQIPQQSTSGTTSAIGNLSASSLNKSQYSNNAVGFSNTGTTTNLAQQVQTQGQQIKPSSTLSVEQSQYFNSLSSQNVPAIPQQQIGAYTSNNSVQYSSTYANVFGTGSTGNSANDGNQLSCSQSNVRRTRTKLPPPSKIPSTAVEMPGDNVNNIFLDVQFGGLDFGTDDSFDTLTDKFNTTVTLDAQQQSQDVSNDFQNKSNVQPPQQQQQQSALTSTLQNTQINESLSGNYAQRNITSQPQQVSNITGNNSSTVGATNTSLESLSKNDLYNQSNNSNTSGYQSSYQNNKSGNVYQQSVSGQNFNSTNYTNVQSSTGSTTYTPQSYNSYQSNSVNTYQQSSNSQNSTNSVTNNNIGSNGNAVQNISASGNVNNTNTNASSNTGYLSSNYSAQQNVYQTSSSVYGGNNSLSNSSGYPGNTTSPSSQYSNFNNSAKLKDNLTTSSNINFDSVSSTNAVSNTGTTESTASSSSNSVTTTNVNNNAVVSVNNASSVTHSLNTTNCTSSNISTNNVSSVVAASGTSGANGSSVSSSNKSGASGLVPNIQMVSQYIQTGLPYYQQPVYSYEDLQMMQQRVPHVGYYDLNYTPTSLSTARDNLGSVAYSMTDGRFARTDNNSSPVSNSLSQQAGSNGPMLNVPYAYFYGGNVMPGSFQYGTPAIYPQQIPTASTASGGQFPKPSYNSTYGSTNYEALSQSADYTKGAYPSSVNQATKSQNVPNPPPAGSATDITSSMYSKGHVNLNKVNSYEKQSFHSGTPPPFNLPNTQAAGGASAQPYGMYLPMPAAGHHNMIHQPIHQDSNTAGQRQQTSNQSKSAGKQQGYAQSYWTGQN